MFGPLTDQESALLGRLPAVSRARGHRLYCVDGTRWLDCWADGGRALMGHRPKGVALRLKNELDRGLCAPYPSLWDRRLEKALLRVFPGYEEAKIYRNAERTLRILELEDWPADPLDLPPNAASLEGALWGRPGLPGHPRADYLFPILPFPGLSEAQPVLFASRKDAAGVPPSDRISPMIAASMTRSCGVLGDEKVSREAIDAEIWERRGPYMLFRSDEDAYRHTFEALFAKRILIAPSRNRPSVFPMELSTKEKILLTGEGFRKP